MFHDVYFVLALALALSYPWIGFRRIAIVAQDAERAAHYDYDCRRRRANAYVSTCTI